MRGGRISRRVGDVLGSLELLTNRAPSRRDFVVSIMYPVSEKFRFKVPREMGRLAVVVVMASLLATAVIYSRNENVVAEDAAHDLKRALHQSTNRQQAEGWFTATPRVAELPDSQILEVASLFPLSPPLPRPRLITLGFYYELVRAQGDGEEGDYVLVARRCIPKVDMPEPCFLPERGRQNFPLRRE
jgi:hypothetical protein